MRMVRDPAGVSIVETPVVADPIHPLGGE
jgi:hypothetical protein